MPSSPTRVAATTAAGVHRPRNDDRFGLFVHLDLFVVASGVGARGAGEAVAEIALDALRESFEASRSQPARPADGASAGASRLAEGLGSAHRRIIERARIERGLEGAIAAVAAISLSGEGVHVGH